MIQSNKTNQGFTLIEILIALVVFTVLASMTSAILYQAFNTRSRLNAQADNLSKLQFAIASINRDVEQFIPRSISNQRFKKQPVIYATRKIVTFTRSGIANPDGKEQRSTLKRVSLRCENHQLIRRSWPFLDGPNRDNYSETVLLGNLSACDFQYLDQNNQLLKKWRNQYSRKKMPVLPKSILFHVNYKNMGSIYLHFIIPEGLYG